MPAAALADKPEQTEDFYAVGTVSYISPGDVKPLDDGYWLIRSREMTGTIAGSVNGDFTVTYKGVVDPLQAGKLEGWMEVGSYRLRMQGQSAPIVQVGEIPMETPYGTIMVPIWQITLSGDWVLTKGSVGKGEFQAMGIVVLNEEGHVVQILQSMFVLTGQWSK